MPDLTPILANLATSKVEVVGTPSQKPQEKNLEAMFLERGFVALVDTSQNAVPQFCLCCCCQASCCCVP